MELALEGLPGIARRLLRGELDPASYRPHPADDSMLAYSCAQNRTIVRLAACGALPRSITADARCSERRSDARAQARRRGGADRFIGCEAQIFGRKEQV